MYKFLLIRKKSIISKIIKDSKSHQRNQPILPEPASCHTFLQRV